MELVQAEAILGLKFPERHRQILLDETDSGREICEFLLLAAQHGMQRLIDTHYRLHSSDSLEKWPDFLVAFASNGCADFFAYDLRVQPPRIIYVDPDRTVEENLSDEDRSMEFGSFDEWYAYKLRQHECANGEEQ